MGRHSGGRHADVLGADGVADVLAVKVDVLGAVHQADGQLDLGQQRRYSGFVLGVDPGAHGVQADGTVHSAGIHIDVAEIFRQPLRQAGFSRPGGPINCYRDHFYHLL